MFSFRLVLFGFCFSFVSHFIRTFNFALLVVIKELFKMKVIIITFRSRRNLTPEKIKMHLTV
jgi:hypothetical protein